MLRTHGVLLATLIIARCGDPAAVPPVVQPVQLTLHVVSGAVVEVHAKVTNGQAELPVYYHEGCGDEDGIWFETIGPDGRVVSVTPPGARPACATQVAMLPARGRLETTWSFDGTLYDAHGQAVAAPPGRYTVIARFRYATSPAPDATVVLEAGAAFRWD